MVKNLKQVFAKFSDEDSCRKFLVQQRWNGVPTCPYCGCQKSYVIEGGKRFKCAERTCYKKYSVTVGTVFEASNIPLTTWFPAMYIISAHKKGISSVQLAKDLGVTQKTAWFMLHRMRESLKENHPELLTGIIEIDETYMARKYRTKYKGLSQEMLAKIEKEDDRKYSQRKGAVIGMKQRDGKIVVKASDRATAKNIDEAVKENVSTDATIMTDEANKYVSILGNHEHLTVNHSKGEFARGIVHVNGVENFWSVMKRGVYGIYHQISYKHLQAYCNEFSYRYNSRQMNDGTRFELSLKGIEGRLSYKRLVYGKGKENKA